MRLFIAIDLDAPFRTALLELQNRLRGMIGPASYPKAENFHLTLKFLGDVPDENVGSLCDALRAISRVGTFALHLAGLLCFPPRGPVRVISAAVHEPRGALSALQKQVESAAAGLGFAAEARAFHPHITLARASRAIPRSRRAEIAQLAADVTVASSDPIEHLSLINSTLTPKGSIYRPLARFDIRLP